MLVYLLSGSLNPSNDVWSQWKYKIVPAVSKKILLLLYSLDERNYLLDCQECDVPGTYSAEGLTSLILAWGPELILDML